MADLSWHIDGANLTGWRIQAASVWRAPVSTRRSVITSPGRHGVKHVNGLVLDEPTVELVLQPLGSSQVEIEDLDQSLMRLISKDRLVLRRTSGGRTAEAEARLVSLTPDLFVYPTLARYLLTLALPGVFFRDPAPILSLAIAAQANVAAAPLTALAGGSGPISDAVVRVVGPCTQVSVSDPASGTGLSWSGSLAAGSYLYLDAASLSARISTSAAAWDSGGTVVTGGLDYPGAGPLQLWPQPAISVTGVGRAATTTVMVRARRAFL